MVFFWVSGVLVMCIFRKDCSYDENTAANLQNEKLDMTDLIWLFLNFFLSKLGYCLLRNT